MEENRLYDKQKQMVNKRHTQESCAIRLAEIKKRIEQLKKEIK